jgi:hypothetical protein
MEPGQMVPAGRAFAALQFSDWLCPLDNEHCFVVDEI